VYLNKEKNTEKWEVKKKSPLEPHHPSSTTTSGTTGKLSMCPFKRSHRTRCLTVRGARTCLLKGAGSSQLLARVLQDKGLNERCFAYQVVPFLPSF